MSEDGRAQAIALLEAHGFAADPLESLAGWSNEVWLAPTHVVRISSGRFRDSFSHEAQVARLIKGAVTAAEIVANGKHGKREWMILVRAKGQSLLSLWPDLAEDERHEAVRQLGQNLKALHQVDLPDDFENPWMSDAVRDPKKAADLYHTQPRHYDLIIEGLRQQGLADEVLLKKATAFLEDRMDLFADETEVLIHSDAHFNNMIWDGRKLTLLDFEVAQKAPRDMELDMLIRFSRDPVMVFGHGQGPERAPEDFAHILPWLQESYPELFADPDLKERLSVYECMMQLHQHHHFPAGHEYDPRPKLGAVLDGTANFTMPEIQ